MLKHKGELFNTLGDEYCVHPKTVLHIFKEFTNDSEKTVLQELLPDDSMKITRYPCSRQQAVETLHGDV